MNHDLSNNQRTEQTSEPVVAACKPRRGLGEVLRSLAGSTAGWRSKRRGSFLVLVVGTLALLAVMALIYSTIGTHDARMSNASVVRGKHDEVPQQVADYITQIIAADIFMPYYETKRPVPGGQTIPMLRKTSDYPYTDWWAKADTMVPLNLNGTPAAPTRYPFSPVGGVSGFMTTPDLSQAAASGMPRAWHASTPWLAATESTHLDFAQAGPTDATRPYLDNHDLLHISNIAPDGHFVNLVNLRGNFSAESGVGLDANSKPRMSERLSLFDAQGRPTNRTDFGAILDFNTPAHLDSRQQWMFRPARPTAGRLPSDPGYEPNQYADPDGSGMYNGRWQELVDWRPSQLPGGKATNILQTDGKMRYFVSTRIIDASALVNVNMATDMHAPPTMEVPAGISPGDIDLQSVLRMYETYTSNNPAGSNQRAGYDGLFQPQPTNDPAYYGATGPASTVYPPPNMTSGYDIRRAQFDADFSYQTIRMALASGTIPSGLYRGLGNGPYLNLSVGFTGDYNLAASDWDFSLSPFLRSNYYMGRALANQDTLFATVSGTPTSIFTGSFGINDLAELVVRRSINDPLYTSPLEAALGGRDNSIVGVFPDTTRYSVLRSNRGLDVERDQRYSIPAGGMNAAFVNGSATYNSTMLHFASDVRQRITPISGGRNFRTLHGITGANGQYFQINPDQLSTSELRIDPRLIMDEIKLDDGIPYGNAAYNQAQQRKALALNKLFTAYADALLPTSGAGPAGAPTAWGRDSAEFAKRKTEFYGYSGPELAAHVAAHMAANSIDMYDTGGVPTVQTLILSSSAPAFLTTHLNEFPTCNNAYYPLPSNGLRGFQLPSQRLGDIAQGDTMIAPAVNIYGIEAQPFLTQVATFTVYADVAPSLGSDEGAGNDCTINGNVDFASNHDIMYRVVAFQLTNPFGVAVNLGSFNFPEAAYFDASDNGFPPLDRAPNYYYVKFGDKTFSLFNLQEQVYAPFGTPPSTHLIAEPSALSGWAGAEAYTHPVVPGNTPGRMLITAGSISIPAGKSVVCYALSDIPQRILENRLAKLSTSAGDDGHYLADIDPITTLPRSHLRAQIRFAIEHNLGLGAADVAGVYWVPEVDPTTGRIEFPKDTNLFPATRVPQVELWRTMRYGDEAVPQNLGTSLPGRYVDGTAAAVAAPLLPPVNDYTNDQLIDRLRVPGSSDLDRKLPAGDHPIVGSAAAGNQDNAHLYMVALHASVRRKGDGHTPGTNAPIGAIPAFCLEPKFATDWNHFEQDSLTTLNDNDFNGGVNFKGGRRKVQEWLTSMSAGGHLDAYTDFKFYKSPNALDTPLIGTTTLDPAMGAPVKYEDHYPEISIADNEFKRNLPAPNSAIQVSTLRPADMLLPLGIGPEEMPYDRAGQPVVDMDLRWTTLGEALALSMGYQTNPPPAASTFDATFPYFVRPNTVKMPLDRGNLRLDDYTPFYDTDSSLTFTVGDERVGSEIPLALNVLDIFTTSPGGAETLTHPTRGTININTVSHRTAQSSLDMLSPPPALDLAGQPWWWWQPSGAASPAPLSDKSDIATTAINYRDKSLGLLRPASQFTSPNGTVVDSTDFTDTGPTPDRPDSELNGRGLTTQVGLFVPATGVAASALHERPGFNSIGELGIVRVRDKTDTSSTSWPCNMDFLGYDILPPSPGPTPGATLGGVTYPVGASGHIGLDSVLYPNPTGGSPALVPSAVPNSYKEQLEVLNGVLNNVSTRSDYFIVWFLIQGYQKSDVDNLGPNDPMIPSVQRRFVMVVDRSKVTKRGDKPDVLLFKEVPVDAEPR